jgi:hypothetical protein
LGLGLIPLPMAHRLHEHDVMSTTS